MTWRGWLRLMGAEIITFEDPVSYGDMADDNGMITAVEAFHNLDIFTKIPIFQWMKMCVHGCYRGGLSCP